MRRGRRRFADVPKLSGFDLRHVEFESELGLGSGTGLHVSDVPHDFPARAEVTGCFGSRAEISHSTELGHKATVATRSKLQPRRAAMGRFPATSLDSTLRQLGQKLLLAKDGSHAD